jgi:hypothetical protein
MATVVIMEVEGITVEDMVDTVMVDVSHYRLPIMENIYCYFSPEYICTQMVEDTTAGIIRL